MKTLQAFWHWVDNDKPTRITREHLSNTAVMALCIAELQVAARAFGDWVFGKEFQLWELCSSGDGSNPNERPEFYRPKLVAAVRDLSLALCPALEAMHAAVGEAVPKPDPLLADSPMLRVDRLTTEEVKPFAREYLGQWNVTVDELKEWLPPLAPSYDTFFGVDRGRQDRDQRLSGARVPKSFHREPRCQCLGCVRDRAEATSQAQMLGVDVRSVQVATHDGLVPLSAETQLALQARNEYDERAKALQAVDATRPRRQGNDLRPVNYPVECDGGFLLRRL